MSTQQAACTLARAGWPQALIPTMVTIGKAESGLDAAAVNRAAEVAAAAPTGWLQVRAFADRVARWNLLDPLQNAQAALEVYQAQGLGAWTTYPQQAARFLPQVQRDLEGFDYAKCGAATGAGASQAGRGMMAGRPTDPWGIAQGITDAVGYTGSALGIAGRRVEASGTVLIGVLVLGAGVAVAGWLFLDTGPGRALKRTAGGAAKAIGTAAVLAPK